MSQRDFVIQNGVLTKYQGPGGAVDVPAGVTTIGSTAFRDCTALTSVSLPDGLTEIGNSAFDGCTGLATISLPDGLTGISWSAFDGCTGLTGISLPDSLTDIGSFAFRGCTALTSVSLPGGLTKIEGWAFWGCTGLTGISLPDGLTGIGDYAFRGCTGLTGVSLPVGLTEIGDSAFQDCTGLTGISLPDGLTAIGDSAFSGCTGLTGISLPDGLTQIGRSAFQDCTGLTSISLPAGLTAIGDWAFQNCTSLTSISLPGGLTAIGDWAFQNCTSLTSISLPGGLAEIGRCAFQGCTGLTRVVLSGPRVRLGENLFAKCPSLTDIALPPECGPLNSEAFQGSAWLDTLEQEGGVCYAGDCAVAQAGNPAKVSFRPGTRVVFGHLFAACQALVQVVLPAGVTEIGAGAFERCEKLSRVELPEGLVKIGKETFSDCERLSRADLPESLTGIGAGAFYNCKSLRDVRLPAGLLQLGNNAFCDCERLTAAEVPQGIARLEPFVFYGCKRLAQVTLPQGLTAIGPYAFEGCAALSHLDFPAGLTAIEDSAFAGSGLTRADLPDGLETIGEGAFQLSRLQHVSLPESVKKIGADAFSDIPLKRVDNAAALMLAGCKISLEPGGDVFWSPKKLEDAAAVWLTQSKKSVKERAEKALFANLDGAVAAMAAVLGKTPVRVSLYKKAAEFALKAGAEVSPESREALCQAARQAKAKAALTLLQDSAPAAGGKGESKPAAPFAGATGHPVEALCLEHFSPANVLHTLELHGIPEKKIPAVPYREGGAQAPAFVVACALTPYIDMGEPHSRWDRPKLAYHPLADQVAATLDPAAFQAALDTMYQLCEKKAGLTRKAGRRFLVPYCRFASAGQIHQVISKMSDWHQWYMYGNAGRDTEALVRDALCLSDSREALLWADKHGNLSLAAKIRGTDADTLRDTVLSDFGLDAGGRKVYDLGGNTVTATLSEELTLSLFDENAQKTVKSIPKKNADPEKYESAKADLADLKKNLKKVAKARCDGLFEEFLSGKRRDGKNWKAVYLTNPLLRQVASLLVWRQEDGTTFTLRDGKAITSDGAEYAVADTPVHLAHPMTMDPADLERWQKYFTDHSLKQPFAQVWEPVVDFKSVREDRYEGCTLLANYLRSRQKHGIDFNFDNGTSELYVSFAGLNLGCEFTEFQRHWLDPDATVVFGKLYVKKPTRRANHVLGLLDKWTVESRIQKDDPTVVQALDSFTLAQITGFLDLAIQQQRTNCTAALLEYKNARFSDFNPMDVFTLD